MFEVDDADTFEESNKNSKTSDAPDAVVTQFGHPDGATLLSVSQAGKVTDPPKGRHEVETPASF